VRGHQVLEAGAPAGATNLPAIVTVVPAEVEAGLVLLQHAPGQSGLSDLARAGQQDHLRLEVGPDDGLEIASLMHD